MQLPALTCRPSSLVFLMMSGLSVFRTPWSDASATVWRVDPAGGGDALSIQQGVNLAGAGDTVLVAPGVYHEHVSIARPLVLLSEAGAEATVLTGDGVPSPVPVLHFEVYADPPSVISGFTIRGGNNTTANRPGGVFLLGHVSLSQCIVSDNATAGWGGGVQAGGYQPIVIEGNRIERNLTLTGGGGGISSLPTGVPPIIRRNVIAGNSAGGRGGGIFIFNRLDTPAEISDNQISGNSAASGGGGLLCWNDLVFARNLVLGNSVAPGSQGSGILIWNYFGPLWGWIMRVEDCVFAGNSGAARGGGALLSLQGAFADDFGIRNCTFLSNQAEEGSAIYLRPPEASSVVVSHCIVAGHSGVAIDCSPFDDPYLSYKCNDFWANQQNFSGCTDPVGRDGNFSRDPFFCDLAAREYTLRSDSPCLPGQHPEGWDCGLIGALGVGCAAPTATLEQTWGALKVRFGAK